MKYIISVITVSFTADSISSGNAICRHVIAAISTSTNVISTQTSRSS